MLGVEGYYCIWSHSRTHYTRWNSSGRGTDPSQRTLPEQTQHSHDTDIHTAGGIRTRNPSNRAAADPRLRRCGHRDRL